REAEIIADAGQLGKITIATNMAGRGTDIKLGPGVCEVGGLHILGTSRHESRRIDNQLRGRSGRQGDPGSSRFFLSLEDDLLRIFGSGKLGTIMEKLGMEEDEPIEHSMISKAIENAQRKVEGHNFDIRKHLLEYDDVMNKQREVIYSQRRKVLESKDVQDIIKDMLQDLVDSLVAETAQDRKHPEDWEWDALNDRVEELFNIKPGWLDTESTDLTEMNAESLQEQLQGAVEQEYEAQDKRNRADQMRQIERIVLLQMVDTLWKDHLLSMDHLKEGIGLRGYGQKNPLDEYKREGFDLFQSMIETVKTQTISTLMHIRILQSDEVERFEEEQRRKQEEELEQARLSSASTGSGSGGKSKTIRRATEKVGRNAPCPCGSGQKYKKCCGKLR
ncbi:MAG: preprotein translocase subunit SecA, partial [Candidatus Electrothrix sp. AW2]|nr:preprotein translocase subunit SecA [Candidatus Electrothrix gigas]